VEQTAFWEPFKNSSLSVILDNNSKKQIEIQARAKIAIESSVQPGMAKIAKFIKDKYLKSTRPKIAATSLPNGQDFYKQCLHFHTSTSLSAKEIHEIGLKEVSRIEGNMKKVIKQLGHGTVG
jgi:uncharacterized protein (DUF885 family)